VSLASSFPERSGNGRGLGPILPFLGKKSYASGLEASICRQNCP